MDTHRSAVQQEEVDRGRQAWERRPFARTFDLIAAEYGWTDDQILDLTMARLTQVREVIWERRDQERRDDLKIRETELRILAGFVAAANGHQEGVKAAEKIRLLDPEPSADGGIDPDSLPSTRMVSRMFAGSR